MLSSLLIAFSVVAAQQTSHFPKPTLEPEMPYSSTVRDWYPTPAPVETPRDKVPAKPYPTTTGTGGWYPMPDEKPCSTDFAMFSTPLTFQGLSRSDVFALLAPKMSKEQQAFGKISKTINPTVKATITYNYRYSSLDDSIRGLIDIFEQFYPVFKSLEQTCWDGDFYSISIKYNIEVGRVARTIE
jgi:hypothetical protein